MTFEKFLDLVRELNARDVEYALVGGIALNIHGIIRATEDIDLFVRPDESNVDRLKDALRAVWNDPQIDEIQAADLAGRYPTIRYSPPDEDFVVDLLSRLGTEFKYDDLEVEVVELEGVPIRLATPLTLYKMKKGTARLIEGRTPPTLRRSSISTRKKMPVEKFADFDQARKALWTDSRNPRLASRIKQLWDFSSRLSPRNSPKGVRKFRTIREANLERETRSDSLV